MKYNIKINSAETVEEIINYWTTEDYITLLEKFNYPDAAQAEKDTLHELLQMAITDYEPNEAAAIVLDYKLYDKLNEGQIHQISNDMLLDKISEEYPDISLHATLFHVNQLLFKAFNGKFPNTKATVIGFSVNTTEGEEETNFEKADILHLLEPGLSGSNLIKRLFGEQMVGTKPFPEAESIVWDLQDKGNQNYELLTSNYWLSKDDLVAGEFEGTFAKEVAVEEAE